MLDLYSGGWTGYCLKTNRRTLQLLGTEKVIFVSRALVQAMKLCPEEAAAATAESDDQSNQLSS